MNQLLMWATEDKPVLDVQEIFTVKPKAKKQPATPPYEEEQPTDIVNEIDRGHFCTVCNMLTTGLPCGFDEHCPW